MKRFAETTKRLKKLHEFGAPKSLKATGFRHALKRLAKQAITQNPHFTLEEYLAPDDGLPPQTLEEGIRSKFEEMFGYVNAVPAGYEITDDGIHIYELETSTPLPLRKIAHYGEMADMGCVDFYLHIFDRHGRERIIDNDDLERIPFLCGWAKGRPDEREQVQETLRLILKGSDPDSEIPKAERTRKWKAAYDALREMGVKM